MLNRPLTTHIVRLAPPAAACAVLWSGFAYGQAQPTTPPSTGDRVLGLDISAWQGNISQTTWNNIYNIENRQFVFIRSSRGGTTGYYNQSDPNNNNGENTLSQRYDDPYFVQNITRATQAGMLAGSYHFSRPDIIASTTNSGGIANNGTDEANHFIEMAGAFMRPGFLPPVHDLEAGISQRTRNQLTQFALDFSNRIYEVMGIRPAIYINGSYTDYLNGASSSLKNQLPTAYPTLWPARWPNQENPNSIPVQTSSPKATYSSFYGPWDANGTQPWHFWQYTSTGRLQSFNNGNSNLDMNVAQGNIEFVKDYLIPAVWMNNNSGNWHDLSNWNSGQAPIVPVQGEGQVPRVGPLTLPTPRLPGQPDATHPMITGADDTVTLDRPNANITVTLSTGTYNIRRLNLYERLNVTGGTLNVGKTIWIDNGGTLSLSGGTVTVEHAQTQAAGALEFAGAGTLRVDTLFLNNSNVSFTGSSGTGLITAKPGVASPSLNMLGQTRTVTVADGSAAVDMRIAVPLANGHLTKTGAGTLELTGNNSAFAGNIDVNGGYLRVSGANQLGTSGARTNNAGSVFIDGNGLNISRPIQLGGRGVAAEGALQNLSGNNTWSGNILLAGTQHNAGDAGLNRIGAAAGTTLTLSGVIQPNTAGASRSWAKTGPGDVVLTGGSPNTYSHLTRMLGGRLIIEKDGALGAAGNNTDVNGNTVVIADSVSTIAFRAPVGSSGFNYNTNEWINTEGTPVAGFAQLDNLGGNNTFAGHVGLGGPLAGGIQQSSIGVTSGSLDLKGGVYARGATGQRDIAKTGAGTLIISGDSGPAPTNSFNSSLVNSTFNINAGTVQLQGTAGNTANIPGVTTWNVNTGAALTLGKTNATGGASVALNGGTLRTSAAGVTVAGPFSLAAAGGGGTIDTIGAAGVNLDGTLSNTGGKTLHKSGAGTLNINGLQNHGAGAALLATAGTTRFNTNAGSAAAPNLSITASNAGTSAVFAATQNLASLQLNSNARAEMTAGMNKAVKTNALSITGGGQLNIRDNGVIVDYSPLATSPINDIRSWIVSGRNSGAWDGPGINSSNAAANNRTAIGYAEGGSLSSSGGTFFGQSFDTTSVLLRWTVLADANLDGVVNVLDFNRLAAGFAVGTHWHEGDFNYDGKVDVLDFNILASHFADSLQAQGASPTAAEWAALSAAVPEPGSVALLALGALTLLPRRRRR